MQPNFLKIRLLMVFLLSGLLGLAQNARDNTITGKLVAEETEEALPYASVVLKDSAKKVVEGVITNENGSFEITNLANGSFIVEIQYLAYQTHRQELQLTGPNKKVDIGTITMKEDINKLEEVVVTGENSEISLRLDKKIFQVGKDVLSQSGSATEVLRNVPSVTVSPSGVVSLRGNNNVNILINGRRSGLTQREGLEQIPSDNIERVEIITNPSARYDAAGSAGIINIILKKSRSQGLNGQVRVVTGIPNDYRLIGNINHEGEKLNWFSNLGIRYTDYVGLYTREQTSQSNGSTIFLDQRQDEDRHDNGRLIYVGFDYFLNERNTITAAYYRNETKDTDETDFRYNYFSSEVLDSTLTTRGNSEERRDYNQLEMNYSKLFEKEGKKFTIDLQYDFWNSTKEWRILTDRTFPLTENVFNLRTRSDRGNNDFTIQSDFVNPVGEKGVIEFGLKYENRIVTSNFKAEEFIDLNFQIVDSIDNALDYNEQIVAAYAQYGNSFGKFSYLLGLRIEYTFIEIEDIDNTFEEINEYDRFFPSANLKYSLSDKASVQLNYSKRINRPQLWQLNPFFELTDFNTRFFGDPSLDPAFTDGLELSFLASGDNFTINPSIYYSDSEGTIQYFTVQNNEDIFVTSLFNLDSETRYGFELSTSYSPFNWLMINGEFNIFGFEQEGMIQSQNFDFSDNTWYANVNARFTLSKGLRFQARYFYEAQRNNAQTRTRPISSLDLGLSQNVFGDRGTVLLNVSNVLNTNKTRETVLGDTFRINQVFNPNAARWTLSFVYKFNRKEGGENRSARGSNRN